MGLLAASMLPLYRRAFAPRPGLRSADRVG